MITGKIFDGDGGEGSGGGGVEGGGAGGMVGVVMMVLVVPGWWGKGADTNRSCKYDNE